MANTLVSRVPPVIDLELYAGDGVAIRFTIKNSDGTPFPLNGVVTSEIREKRPDTGVVTTFNIDSSQQTDGIVILSLLGDQTQSLIPDGKEKWSGVWDAEYKPDGAEPVTLIQGKVKCDCDVTRYY